MRPPSVTWLISDPHFNHDNIATYCRRPANFTELIMKNWNELVWPKDIVICLGDFMIGNRRKASEILAELMGQKILVLGNHDRSHSPDWWMRQGFAFACQAMIYRNMWLTHEPANILPPDTVYNIHGHLHNFWEDEHHEYTPKSYHRLFAVEYTNYRPVEFDKFVAQPKKFKATAPQEKLGWKF